MEQFGVLVNILALLAMLTPIVFIHEFGHYYAARKNNVIVDVFSVGFACWAPISLRATSVGVSKALP